MNQSSPTLTLQQLSLYFSPMVLNRKSPQNPQDLESKLKYKSQNEIEMKISLIMMTSLSQTDIMVLYSQQLTYTTKLRATLFHFLSFSVCSQTV